MDITTALKQGTATMTYANFDGQGWRVYVISPNKNVFISNTGRFANKELKDYQFLLDTRPDFTLDARHFDKHPAEILDTMVQAGRLSYTPQPKTEPLTD